MSSSFLLDFSFVALVRLYVYRNVALVDRSEYPSLVYNMDQWINLNGLVGVPFIASNHPYSRYAMSACSTHGRRSVAWARTVHDPLNGRFWHRSQQIHLTDQWLFPLVTPCGRSAPALKFLLLNLSPSGWTRSSHADGPWIIARQSMLYSQMVYDFKQTVHDL
jgi:hypothetical protein